MATIEQRITELEAKIQPGHLTREQIHVALVRLSFAELDQFRDELENGTLSEADAIRNLVTMLQR